MPRSSSPQCSPPVGGVRTRPAGDPPRGRSACRSGPAGRRARVLGLRAGGGSSWSAGQASRTQVLLPLWVAATAGIIWWLARRPALLDRAERFLTLTSGMLVAWFMLSIAVAEYRSARAVRESAVVQRLAEPIRVQPGTKAGPKRDIYLIVLDEYANAEVTERLFGFDNHAFLDSLRQLGFVVPAVHSNYSHTFLSVAVDAQCRSHRRTFGGARQEIGGSDRYGLSGQAQPNGAIPQVAGLPIRALPLALDGRQPGTTHGRTWSFTSWTRMGPRAGSGQLGSPRSPEQDLAAEVRQPGRESAQA